MSGNFVIDIDDECYPELHPLTEDVIKLCKQQLLPRHRNLYINVEFDDLNDAAGYCYQGCDNREIMIQLNPTVYYSHGKMEFVDTLCHEMIHCKQIVRRQLVEYHRPVYGKRWLCTDGVYRRFDGVDYCDTPWEIEAYEMSGQLADQYVRTIK